MPSQNYSSPIDNLNLRTIMAQMAIISRTFSQYWINIFAVDARIRDVTLRNRLCCNRPWSWVRCVARVSILYLALLQQLYDSPLLGTQGGWA